MDSALLVMCLDEQTPTDASDGLKQWLCGNGIESAGNRWFDKINVSDTLTLF